MSTNKQAAVAAALKKFNASLNEAKKAAEEAQRAVNDMSTDPTESQNANAAAAANASKTATKLAQVASTVAETAAEPQGGTPGMSGEAANAEQALLEGATIPIVENEATKAEKARMAAEPGRRLGAQNGNNDNYSNLGGGARRRGNRKVTRKQRKHRKATRKGNRKQRNMKIL